MLTSNFLSNPLLCQSSIHFLLSKFLKIKFIKAISKLILQLHARLCIANVLLAKLNSSIVLFQYHDMTTWWRAQRKYGQGHGLQTKQVQCQSVTWETGSTASASFINNVEVSAPQCDHHIPHAHPNSNPNLILKKPPQQAIFEPPSQNVKDPAHDLKP